MQAVLGGGLDARLPVAVEGNGLVEVARALGGLAADQVAGAAEADSDAGGSGAGHEATPGEPIGLFGHRPVFPLTGDDRSDLRDGFRQRVDRLCEPRLSCSLSSL